MATAKQLYGTHAYEQMRQYINRTHPDKTPRQRAAHLGALVKLFLANVGRQWAPDHRPYKGLAVAGAFVWEETPEGHEFWRRIDQQLPPVVKPAKQAVEAPKLKRVGWWG